MTLNEAEHVLVRMSLCKTLDTFEDEVVRMKVLRICQTYGQCQGCPYYVNDKEVDDALNVAFHYYTPEELQYDSADPDEYLKREVTIDQ